LANWADEMVVYVDEAGMDNREDYSYGWNEKGQRFHALKSGRRQGRVNMIAAFCNRKLMAPFTVEGSCNRTVVEIWLETCLIPLLSPGQVVVMDNATFHKGGNIRPLAKVVAEVLWGLNKGERSPVFLRSSGLIHKKT
jgi:hypothetical protein